MPEFCKTNHCQSRVHCRTCRNLDGGRAWRRSVLAAFGPTDGPVDFDCPTGKPWGYGQTGGPEDRKTGRPKNRNGNPVSGIPVFRYSGPCPHLRRTCCGQPDICGLTGADTNPAACARCKLRPGD